MVGCAGNARCRGHRKSTIIIITIIAIASLRLLSPRLVQVLACGPYDAVVIDDQLTKQTQPLELLAGIGGLFAGAAHAWSGVVLVASANAWDPTVTPRNSWMGGFKMNGEDMPTLVSGGHHHHHFHQSS